MFCGKGTVKLHMELRAPISGPGDKETNWERPGGSRVTTRALSSGRGRQRQAMTRHRWL